MDHAFDLILAGGSCVTAGGAITVTDIGVREGRIAALGDLGGARAAQRLSMAGLHVLPGVIDSQVHFREPGLEHKEDLGTGTAAAALGGVTAIFEMPNTKPGTLTARDLGDKARRAQDRVWCDVAFFVGAADENADLLEDLELLEGCAGIKIFMGSSTGSLLVADDDTLARVLTHGRRRVAVHCEDEPRLLERKAMVAEGAPVATHAEWRDAESARRATERLLRLARAARRRVHVLHVSTADEVPLLQANRDLATMEVTPQHLTLSAPEAYERLGSRAQMNPPLRDGHHRAALWQALQQGLVDVIGSDHAPHTLAEKEQPYPRSPSGMPGVQTLVPVMLDHVNAGRLSLQRFCDLVSAGPARVYGVANKGRIALGYDADFTVVDLHTRRRITDQWIASRCGWTPFDGMEVMGWPLMTVVRGHVVMREGQLLEAPVGRLVRFQEVL